MKKKPYTEAVEWKELPDAVVAEKDWEVYKSRNDSVIVDLFQGQYRSKLTCPECNRVSITFDPFLYLTVPVPRRKVTLEVWFFALNGAGEPRKVNHPLLLHIVDDPRSRPLSLVLRQFSVRVNADSSVDELTSAVGEMVNVESDRLRLAVVSGPCFEDFPGRAASVAHLCARYTNAALYFYEVLSSDDCDDPVIEFRVTQVMPTKTDL